jgi:hypothetical protein
MINEQVGIGKVSIGWKKPLGESLYGNREKTADPSASLVMTKGRVRFRRDQVRMEVERTADPSASLLMNKK